ncbi:hypothetical protein GIB67_021759 [Kingdonia uniflora]|uniref:Apple domain-containing protein n=1 Tax=Kingdonia uniflora TaxID=39325 RepID=A0A7J7M9M0_9MAGN|nr:hypothetical protein GIB67_021759 [Kingdonia uniflora]
MDAEEGSKFYLVWNRSKIYWTTGVWSGERYANIPEMNKEYYYNFGYVSNEREDYFTYSMKDDSVLSRSVVDISGRIKQYTWMNSSQEWVLIWSSPRDPCDVYSVCWSFGSCNTKGLPICGCLYGFEPSFPKDWKLSDWSGGCVRKTPLKYGSTRHGDGFLKMSNLQWPTNYQKLKLRSVEKCELACIRNISCSAYSYSVECLIWSGGLRNLKELAGGDENGRDIFIRLAFSELPKTEGNKKLFTLVTVVVCVGCLCLLGIMFVRIWRCRERRLVAPSWAVQGSLRPFKYREIQIATKNFSEKLGSGSFGSVFKGSLPDSTLIAVKMLEGFRQGEKEF